MSSAVVGKTNQYLSEFELKSIPGMEFWYDLSDTSTFTTSGTYPTQTITSDIIDKSGNSRNLTNTYDATTVLNYDSVNNNLHLGTRSGFNFTTAYTASSAFETAFFVLTNNQINSTYLLLTTLSNGGRSYRLSGGRMAYARNGAGISIQSNAVIPSAGINVYTFVNNNNFMYMYWNGTFVASGSISAHGAGLTSTFGAGGGTRSGDYLGGINEMICFSSALPDGDRASIEHYLINKWKVQSSASSLIPTSLGSSSCRLWLDSSDDSSVIRNASNLVSQWTDKSGNNNHAVQATDSAKPTYTTTGITFGPTVTTAKLITPYNLASAETVFMVAETGSASVGAGYLLGSSATSGRYLRFASNVLNLYFFNNSNAVYIVARTSTGIINTVSTRFIAQLCISGSGGSYNTTFNKSFETFSSGSTYEASTSTVIGNRLITDADANAYPGKICEVIAYNTVLNASDRKNILNYLTAKWSITAANPSLTSAHPFQIARPFTRSFLPTDIENCVLWLDAADSSTITPGSTVTTWADKSGNSNNATTAAGTLSYSSNGINFTGSQAMTTSLSSVMTSQSVFVVASANSSNYMDLVAVNSSTVNNGIQLVVNNYVQNVTRFGGLAIMNGSNVGINTRFLYNVTYISGGQSFVYVNGSQTGSNATSPTISGTGTVSIGAYRISSFQEFYIGTINEILIYNRSLNIGERQEIESYLAQKWGLVSNVPSSHPAKLYRTLTTAFDPRQLPGCNLWVDALDTTTISPATLGGNITSWNDKSGIGNNLSNIVSPNIVNTVRYASFGRYNGIYFPGRSGLRGNYVNTSTTMTVFCVMAPNDATTIDNNRVVSFQNSGTSGTVFDFLSATVACAVGMSTSTQVFIQRNSASVNAAITFNALNIVSDVFNGTTANIWTNGQNSSSVSSTGNFSTTTVGLGWYPFPTGTVNSYFGYIFEVISYNLALSTYQRQLVEGYLAHKWGLVANLPATHPYKKSKP